MFKKIIKKIKESEFISGVYLPFTCFILTVLIMVTVLLLTLYVNEIIIVVFTTLLLILKVIDFISDIKKNIKFYKEMDAYTASGYTIEDWRERMPVKDLLQNDTDRNFIWHDIGSHSYTINHSEKEIHVYR